MEVWKWSPQRLGDCHNSLIKMKHFEAYLDLNFCFKTYSDNG